jgi:pyruvate-formate lyase-activating enzyme
MSTSTEKDIIYGFQSEHEAAFPIVVQLALMHYICNSRCKKCPVGLFNRGELEQDGTGEFDPIKRQFFPFELFTKIADEIAKYPWSILRFHGRGEPLLHPHYMDMITYAKKVGIGKVTSFTNAVLLDKEMAEAILDSGLDLLELSIDTYSEKLYQEFRGTKYFPQVVRNAENLIRARNRRGERTTTRIIVSAVDCPEFQIEKEDFYRYWSERADMVIFRPYHTYGGRLKPLYSPNCSEGEPGPCAQLWTRFSINPWGQVNACFNDWADIELVGDLNEPGISIANIWRNDKFESIREASIGRKSILKCCGTCLATKNGWIWTYQRLIEKLFAKGPNKNLE